MVEILSVRAGFFLFECEHNFVQIRSCFLCVKGYGVIVNCIK